MRTVLYTFRSLRRKLHLQRQIVDRSSGMDGNAGLGGATNEAVNGGELARLREFLRSSPLAALLC